MVAIHLKVQPMRDLNYCHQRSVELSVAISPLEAWNPVDFETRQQKLNEAGF